VVVVLEWRYSAHWQHRINDDDDNDDICCVCRCWRLVVSSARQAVKRGLDQWNLRHRRRHSHVNVRTTTVMLRTTNKCRAMRLYCLTPSRLHLTATTRPQVTRYVAVLSSYYTSVVCLYVSVTLWSTVDAWLSFD